MEWGMRETEGIKPTGVGFSLVWFGLNVWNARGQWIQDEF